MRQATARDTAIDDAMQLFANLELPYLEALEQHLAQHIAQRRQDEYDNARAEIRRIMASAGLTADDVLALAKPVRAKAVKYRHPDGRSWSGAGREPLWIRGQDRTQFLIQPA